VIKISANSEEWLIHRQFGIYREKLVESKDLPACMVKVVDDYRTQMGFHVYCGSKKCAVTSCRFRGEAFRRKEVKDIAGIVHMLHTKSKILHRADIGAS
jgi:hypothetical protein